MPVLKPFFLVVLPIVVLCLLKSAQLQAQGSAFNHRLMQDRSIDPSSVRSMDSLHKLNAFSVTTNSANLYSLPHQQSKREKPVVQPLMPRPMRIVPKSQQPIPAGLNRTSGTVCYTISGRDFLDHESLTLWTHDPTVTADGNVIVCGQFGDYSVSPMMSGGFCMKTDFEGNVIWAKLYDSTNRQPGDYIVYIKSIELRNGSIILAGRTTNTISGNDDLILTKLDNNGNIIWSKTYASRFWQGFNGSGDAFGLKNLEEDPATGEIYFVGDHWAGNSTVTKVDAGDGHIMWSKAYSTGSNDSPFGIIINSNNLLLFQMTSGRYIGVNAIDKTTGDTLFSKHYEQTINLYEGRIYSTYEVVKLNNGHFLCSGSTTQFYEYPIYTGTKDLYHAAIIELDENLNYVKAYGFKNRVESNGLNTKISLYPDGTGVFTMLKWISSYNAEASVCLFNNEKIYHQRKRIHNNEGIPYQPLISRLPDGGFLDIKLLGDSVRRPGIASRIDYYRMHTADTASLCLGIQDSSTSIWYLNFTPSGIRLDTIRPNVFSESRVKTYTTSNFITSQSPACEVISHCDTLAIKATTTTICAGTSVTITVSKNKECGSWVPLAYDTNWVSHVTRLTDTTYNFRFDNPGSGFVSASLMGCVLQTDSLLLQVLQAPKSLDLGPDRLLCPANTIPLNAKKGYASYLWQDGSTDSVYSVTKPGVYYVTATDACGGVFRDTVAVTAAPPIPFDAGPDRTKCNNDTLVLTAPDGFLNYSWSNNYNISSLTTQRVVVNPAADTSYFVKAEKTPGCFAYDTIRIKVNRSPDIYLGNDTSFCNGNNTALNAGTGFQHYKWSTGETSQEVIVKTAGQYSVVGLTAEGCSSRDTMNVVTVFPLPIVSLDKTTTICSGTSRTLDAGSFSSYYWNTGATTANIKVSNIGLYTVTVTDKNGCKSSDSASITTILTVPAGFLPPDTVICSYGTLELKPLSVFNSYKWSNNSTSSILTINKPGTYWLNVTDRNNCIGRDSINIGLKNCMEGFYVPTAFTANKDGRNDRFKPLLFGIIKKYEFAVINRLGQTVFKTKDPGAGWDGLLNGIEQQSDTYVWYCYYQFEGQPEHMQKGTVILLK